MESLRPNQKRAKNAIILLWLVIALEIISLISGYFSYDLLQTIKNGGDVSIEKAAANDTRVDIIDILYVIIFVIWTVLFIQWFRRAYYNLHLKVEGLAYSEKWAALSWFVPIIHLYRPYRIMKELYQKTDELLTKKLFGYNHNLNVSFLGIWWTLWIISNFIGHFVIRYSINAESMEDITICSIVNMIDNAIGIPLDLITIKVIKDYAKIEPLIMNLIDENSEQDDI